MNLDMKCVVIDSILVSNKPLLLTAKSKNKRVNINVSCLSEFSEA